LASGIGGSTVKPGSLERLHGNLVGYLLESNLEGDAAGLLRLNVTVRNLGTKQAEIEERHPSISDRTVGIPSQWCRLQGRGKTMIGWIALLEWSKTLNL
jgi:hypothetical protein